MQKCYVGSGKTIRFGSCSLLFEKQRHTVTQITQSTVALSTATQQTHVITVTVWTLKK